MTELTEKPKGRVNPWLGVLVVVAVLVAVNVIARSVRLRADLTAEQVFTLAPGTAAFLSDLPDTVTLKFYYSRGNHVPSMLKQYLQRVVDLLREMERASGGMLVLELHDPAPDSDEEEWAQRYGLVGQPVTAGGDLLYMGVVAVAGAREAAIPFLPPGVEAQLEYNLARLLHEVSRTARPRIGILSNLPVMGTPRAPQMRGRAPDSAWLMVQELRRHYEVVQVRAEAESIGSDLDVLLVIHPKMLTENHLYAIDQFVMRGGSLIVLQDPMSLVERETMTEMSSMQMVMGYGSDLNRLTAGWGAEMILNEVVADPASSGQVSFGPGRTERMPTWLQLRPPQINTEDALTAGLRSLALPFAGGFQLRDVEGVTSTVLLSSSDESLLVNSFHATMPGPEKMREARPVGALPLAVRLVGNFSSAFTGGAPAEVDALDHRARSGQPGVVVLVGDVDFMHDRNAFRVMNLGPQTMVEYANDNFGFLLGLVEQVSGSQALIGLRSRGVLDRPFTRVVALEEAAARRWQAEELNLMERLQDLQRKLAALPMAQDDSQQFVISPEQRSELEEFRRVRFETQRELKQVRRNLRKDIETLGLQVKAWNIAAIPALIAVFGLIKGWWRRSR